jgi:hypothetical protein
MKAIDPATLVGTTVHARCCEGVHRYLDEVACPTPLALAA